MFSPHSTSLFSEYHFFNFVGLGVFHNFVNVQSIFPFFQRLEALPIISLCLAKELVCTNIRKDFTNFYVYRTFENAMHTFWADYEYSDLIDGFKQSFGLHQYSFCGVWALYDIFFDVEVFQFGDEDVSLTFSDVFFFNV